LIILGLGAAASVVAWTLKRQQPQRPARERVIKKAFTRNPIIEISEVQVSQKTVEPDKAFEEDDDWLKKVFLKVKNISDKPIVSLEITVDFPDTAVSGSIMSYKLVFGRRPGSRLPQKHDPIFLMPGDMLEVPLSKEYDKIKTFVERRHGIASIHNAELAIGFVVFADKTAWGAGNFYRQDPDNPDHYINVGNTPPQ
jgi:hypothetical protein